MHRFPQRVLRSAFTLLEIMLVVAIIGILITVVTIKLGNKHTHAAISATKGSISTIKLGIAQYELEHGRQPEKLSDLVTGEKHYLDQETVPTDAWGQEFKYYLKGDLVKIRSGGPDKIFDTKDDIENQ